MPSIMDKERASAAAVPSHSFRITRRELLAGTGASAAALVLDANTVQAQAPSRPIVFVHTTVINADAVLDDVALAIRGDRIAAQR